MPNVSFRSSSSVANQSAATFSVNKPAGVVDTDLLIAFQATAGGLGHTPPVAPTGWTIVGTRQSYGSGTNDLVAWWKYANGEGASWTFNNATGGMSPITCVNILAFQDAFTQPEGSVKAGVDIMGAGPVDPGNYTTLEANEAIAVGWALGTQAGGTITPHASFTALTQLNGGGGLQLRCGYKLAAAAGSVTNNTGVIGGGNTSWGGILVAIASEAAAAAATGWAARRRRMMIPRLLRRLPCQ